MKPFTAMLISTLCITAAAQNEISFPLGNEEVVVEGAGDSITFSNYEYRSESSGKPKLPAFTYTFLLPPDADLNAVSLEIQDSVEEIVSTSARIARGEPYQTAMGPIEIAEEQEVHSRTDGDFYPSRYVSLKTCGTLGDCKLVTIRVMPFKQDTVNNTLKKITSGTLKLSYATGAEPTGGEIMPWLVDDLKRITENYNDAVADYSVIEATDTPHLVILTSEKVKAGSTVLNSFVASKESNGFKVTVVTESEWGGASWDKADDIRSWIQKNYKREQIEYLLLIGDPTPNSGDVPMKMTLPMATPIGNDCPTDYYYAEISGNWDLNGNAWAGEGGLDLGVGGADNYPEIAVGRIPVYGDDYATLDKILQKTIDYTTADPASIEWRKNILMVAEPSDFLSPSWQFGEAIHEDFVEPNDWGSFRIYKESYGDVVPDLQPTTIENVAASWKAKPYGLVDWQTHGNEDLAKKVMDSETAAQLNDEYPSIIYQGSCLNGKPEDPNNLGYALLKNGAVATIAAARLSLYRMGQTDPKDIKMTNLSICYYFAKFSIEDNEPIGNLLNRLKREIDGDFKGLWLNYTDYNVYGDPTVSLTSASGQSVSAVETVSKSSVSVNAMGDALQFNVGTEAKRAKLTLSTLQGRVVFSRELAVQNGVVHWDKATSLVAKGVYIVSLAVTSEGKAIAPYAGKCRL